MAKEQEYEQDVATQTGNAMGTETPPQPSEFTPRSTLVLAAGSLALFCTAGFINAVGVFQTYYTQHYLPQESNFQISWIGSFSIFLFFGLGFPAGLISDRFGPTIPITFGAICQVVAIFMISLCTEYYQFFLAQGVLLGIGLAFITIPVTSVTPLYFQRNRGLAQGISVAGSSLGGVIWPIMLDQLLNGDGVSFGWTIRIVGFMMLLFLVVVIVGVRRPRAGQKSGGINLEAKQETPQEMKKTKKDYSHLRQGSYIFLCSGLGLFYFGFFAPFFYVSTYATSLGVSESFSIYLIAILNAASIFGRTFPGFFADRLGHFNVITISMLGSAIIGFCWTAATSVAGLIVWSLAYGFVSGAVLSLQFACASLVATKETMGAAIGIIMASIALAALFGSPIAGELVNSGYIALSMFAGGTMLAGSILVIFARLSRNRNLLAKA